MNLDNPANVYNWYTKLDLVCKNKKAMAFIGTFAFIGISLGCLFVPRLGDLYGRKLIFLISMFVQAPIYAVASWTSNLKIVYGMCFLIGPCIIGRMSQGFLLLMELVPSKWQAAVGASIMVSEGAACIIWTIYF